MKIMSAGGDTWAPDRTPPRTGFMVSLADTEHTVKATHFTDAVLAAFEAEHTARVASDDQLFFGAWLDGATVFLDVSMHFEDHAEALLAGLAENQIAVFDLSAATSLYL
ncbi:hypothetical protein ACIRPS_18030 [Streptomyces griseoviridis]